MSKRNDVVDWNVLPSFIADTAFITVPNPYLFSYPFPIPSPICKFTSHIMRAIFARSKFLIPKTIAGKTTKTMAIMPTILSSIQFKRLLVKLHTTIIAFQSDWLFPYWIILTFEMRQTLWIALTWWWKTKIFISPFTHTRPTTKSTQLVISSPECCTTVFANPIYHTLMVV